MEMKEVIDSTIIERNKLDKISIDHRMRIEISIMSDKEAQTVGQQKSGKPGSTNKKALSTSESTDSTENNMIDRKKLSH